MATTEATSIRRTTTPKPKPSESRLGFGAVFTDHMLLQDYDAEQGWQNARIEPYHALSLDPAALVLHYAQEVFDGLKAFRGQDGRVRLFRPQKHVERLISSSRRLCIPELPAEQTREALVTLVQVEQEWVPSAVGTSLYLRPTIIATEPSLAVRPATSYLFYVILSPVGSYFAQGPAPLKILVADQYVRAAEGGVGAAKTGGNYAASLYAAEAAHQQGYSQVLWLDSVQRRYIDEVGTMNVMLRLGDEVVTPPLSGTILPGVTRDSVLTLLRDWGIHVSERPIAMDEVLAAAEAGTLQEAWGTGTAAAISPIGELSYKGQQLIVNGGQVGPWTRRLYDTLLGIQYATLPDPHQWMVAI